MKEKKKYKGRFNLCGEVHEYYRFATSILQAKLFMIMEMARDTKHSSTWLALYFGDEKDNCKIIEVKGG